MAPTEAEFLQDASAPPPPEKQSREKLHLGFEIQFGILVDVDVLRDHAHRYWNAVHPRCPTCDDRLKNEETISREKLLVSSEPTAVDTFRFLVHILKEAGFDTTFTRKGEPKRFGRWHVTWPPTGPVDDNGPDSTYWRHPWYNKVEIYGGHGEHDQDLISQGYHFKKRHGPFKLIEINTPLFDCTFDKDWRNQPDHAWILRLQKALGTITSHPHISIDLRSDLNLHVHLGRYSSTLYPTGTLLNLLAILGIYEGPLVRLQPYEGGIAGRFIEHLRSIKGRHRSNDLPLVSREQFITELYQNKSKADLEFLLDADKPPLRLNLSSEGPSRFISNDKMAIEFCDHCSTLQPDDIYWWATLCVRIVQCAYEMDQGSKTKFKGPPDPKTQVSLVDLFDMVDLSSEGRFHFRHRYMKHIEASMRAGQDKIRAEMGLERDREWG